MCVLRFKISNLKIANLKFAFSFLSDRSFYVHFTFILRSFTLNKENIFDAQLRTCVVFYLAW